MVTTNFDELEDMKQQMRQLQDKLKERDIVNDRMIHQAVSSNLGSIMRRDVLQLVILLVMLLVYPSFFMMGNCSLGFIIYCELLFVVCACAQVRNMHLLEKARRSMGNNIVDANTRLLKLKQSEQRWIRYVAPVAISIFLGWFVYEVYYNGAFITGEDNETTVYSLICGCVVGAAIGGLIGYFRVYRPKIDALDNAMRQLAELKENY